MKKIKPLWIVCGVGVLYGIWAFWPSDGARNPSFIKWIVSGQFVGDLFGHRRADPVRLDGGR